MRVILAKRRSQGLVNFVIALAYHFCLALSAAFTQPGDHLLAEPCERARRQKKGPLNIFWREEKERQ